MDKENKVRFVANENRPKVYISHSYADSSIARQIAKGLRASNIKVFLDADNVFLDADDIAIEQSIRGRISDFISTSDFVLVLLSPESVSQKWVVDVFKGSISKDIAARAINVFPAMVADCIIPNELATIGYLDLRHDLQAGIRIMSERFWATKEIEFNHFDGLEFERLVRDLLVDCGFRIRNVASEVRFGKHVYDFKADYSAVDPFGFSKNEVWIVEVKFYKESRVDLAFLKQFSDMAGTLPENYRGLVVTNSQLTSIARDWLSKLEQQHRARVRVIDGTDLRRLLIEHPSVVERQFQKGSRK